MCIDVASVNVTGSTSALRGLFEDFPYFLRRLHSEKKPPKKSLLPWQPRVLASASCSPPVLAGPRVSGILRTVEPLHRRLTAGIDLQQYYQAFLVRRSIFRLTITHLTTSKSVASLSGGTARLGQGDLTSKQHSRCETACRSLTNYRTHGVDC